MNIFILSKKPKTAARMQCDKHVVKMILESTQMLSTAHHIHGSRVKLSTIYRPAYQNHPCTVWARQTFGNYQWLLAHAEALAQEYTRRYGKTHKSSRLIAGSLQYNPCPKGRRTAFAQAMPDKYKVHGDAVQAYRQYYIHEKTRAIAMTWRTRSVPKFITERNER